LAPFLIKAIRHHHDPPRANESMRIAAIVHSADAICRALGLGNGGDEKIPRLDEESWALLNFDRKTLKRLYAEIEEDLENAHNFMPNAHK